ncbi:DUF2511 domain-containing protein [Lentzea sp. NPDC058450]|uniref:DUF2511 domain-containing protein n=1 Tax=Lentzea sp. NPDC058450 TaxID=3346505 RepID=UPI0036583292
MQGLARPSLLPQQNFLGEQMNLRSASRLSLLLTAALVGSCGTQESPSGSKVDPATPSVHTPTTTATRPPDPTQAAREPGEVRREDFGEKWPLTVDSGVVRCQGGAVTFTTNGSSYDVNGTAMTRNRGKRIHEIWADDPNNAGLKIYIGPILDLGLKLC